MKTFRMWVPKRQGRCALHFHDTEITPNSVIHISASEATAITHPQSFSGQSFGLNFGGASITVQNVTPGNGVVDFYVFVDFHAPLNVATDITILDPPVQVIIGT